MGVVDAHVAHHESPSGTEFASESGECPCKAFLTFKKLMSYFVLLKFIYRPAFKKKSGS